jgi:hypothetical protein
MREPVKVVAEPGEPIFGSQAGSFFRQLVTLAFALGLVLVVLLLGVYAKDGAQRLLYGERVTSRPALQPGESATVDGVTIKRIN